MYTNDWDSPRQGRSPFSMTPWVRRLLIANAVVYLLTLTVFTGRWFGEMFGFSPDAVLRQPWTIITYMFLHARFWHIALNMVVLFFFGSAVEERMGSPAFARYYFFCGAGGAVLSLLLAPVFPVGLIIGASAAVLGVALAFAMFWPDAPIYVFPLPVPIKAKWLVLGLATIDLVFVVLPINNGVANLAHLGGFLFGFLYLRVLPRVADHAQSVAQERNAVRVLVHPGAESAEEEEEPRPERSRQRSSLDDLDRVLDKISESGLQSLTAEERKVLDQASRHLRDN